MVIAHIDTIQFTLSSNQLEFTEPFLILALQDQDCFVLK